MLKTRQIDGPICASCGRPAGLVQINGSTVLVEKTAGFVGGSLIVLEVHRCEPTAPGKAPTGRARKVL